MSKALWFEMLGYFYFHHVIDINIKKLAAKPS